MEISELIKKYPNKTFVELNDFPNGDSFYVYEIKELSDFISLANLIGYYISETDEDEAIDLNFSSIIDSWINYNKISYEYSTKFRETIEDAFYNDELPELTDICNKGAFSNLALYDLEKRICWTEDNGGMDFEEWKKAVVIINELFDKFKEDFDEEEQRRKNEIQAFIEGYKNKYNCSKNKTEKNELINEIQHRLKELYGLDGRSDSIASKTGLKNILEK